MKIGIDSYCFHRYFGETYPFQRQTTIEWTLEDFLQRAKKWRVEGVSLESCFFPNFTERTLRKTRDLLDEYRFERVWAWGHPNGLEGGKSKRAVKELEHHFDYADQIGAKVMRIVGGNRSHRDDSVATMIKRLIVALRELSKLAEDYGIVMAIENHIDLTADEMLEVVRSVDSKWLGINLDTGNNIRLHEDCVEECRKMAPYARATHIKDIGVGSGAPKDFTFWPSVPLGAGLIDLNAIVDALKAVNYDGLYCVEVDYLREDCPDEETAVEQSIKYLRGLA